MRLVLLRHGESEAKEARPDAERRLTPAGQAQAAEVGAVLAAHGIQAGLVLSSPAVRSMATALAAAGSLGYEAQRIVADGAVYAGDENRLLGAVRAQGGGAATVVVVGHNPWLRRLAVLLCGLNEGWSLPKGHAAVVTADLPWNEWGPGTSRLEYTATPSGLRRD